MERGINRKTDEIITELKELNIYLAALAETKRKRQGSKIKVQDVRICRGPVHRSDYFVRPKFSFPVGIKTSEVNEEKHTPRANYL